MTICVAAIGKDENGIDECVIFATDHMITIKDLGQFEHSIKKYKVLNENAVAMLAGNPDLFGALTENTKSCKLYSDTVKQISVNIKEFKNKDIGDLLEDYGLEKSDLKSLMTDSDNDYADAILERISEYEFASHILLVGFDEYKSAMITTFVDKNPIECRDYNFEVIGSGWVQAMNTLMFQGHTKDDSLTTTIYDVYKAKRNAEVCEGVGRKTDLLIFRKDKGCQKLTNEDLDRLEKIYQHELSIGRTCLKLSELSIGASDANEETT